MNLQIFMIKIVLLFIKNLSMKIIRISLSSVIFFLISGSFLFLANSCTHDGIPADQFPQIYYSDVEPIFATCYECHGGKRNESDINLTTYANIMGSGGVVPGNASKSKVYLSLSSTFNLMPPSGALKTNERTKIWLWIEQGAKEKP